jgi:mRNA interferase MazF
MNEGDVILSPLLQAEGQTKNRPAVALRELPLYGDMLVCGISTQPHQLVPGFDELVTRSEDDFADSVIRLSLLAVLTRKSILGSIGVLSPERHGRLLRRLSAYLVEQVK